MSLNEWRQRSLLRQTGQVPRHKGGVFGGETTVTSPPPSKWMLQMAST